MQIVKGKELKFIPAGHEDLNDPGVLKKVLFQLDQLGDLSNVQMVNWAIIEPGKEFVSHCHKSMQEIFVVISGCGEFTADGNKENLHSGDAVLVPIQVEHSMKNIGYEVLTFLTIGLV